MKPVRGTPQALGPCVRAALAPVVRLHGFATADVLTRWADIVGSRFLHVTRPLRVVWPRERLGSAGFPEDRPSGATAQGVNQAPWPGSPAQAHRGGVLIVQVEGAHALEFQHHAPALLERLARLYGWRAIDRISLRQAPVRGPPRRAPQPPAPPVAIAGLDAIEAPALRQALAHLGAEIARAQRTKV